MRKDKINPAAKIFLDWAISEDAMAAYFISYPLTSVAIDTPLPEGNPAGRDAAVSRPWWWHPG